MEQEISINYFDDGLLRKDVQTALPGITDDYIIRAEHINHEQMKHDINVAKKLDWIFEGVRYKEFKISRYNNN